MDQRPLLAERDIFTAFVPVWFPDFFEGGILLVGSPSTNTKHDLKGDYEELPNFKVFHVIFQHHRKLLTGDGDRNWKLKNN